MTARPRLLTTLAGASAFAVTLVPVSSGRAAFADPPLAPRTTFSMVVDPATGGVAAPTDGEAIPNIDSVKSTIRAYYNASGGKANKTSSRYLVEVRALERGILADLPTTAPAGAALTFDVDDTLLWNYDFEDAATNFVFDRTLNAQWVADHLFPAVPGMPALLRELASRGYAIYAITGRPAAQEADTVANLTEQGFTDDGTAAGTPLFDAANLYTKGDVVVTAGAAAIPSQPWVDCAADGTPASCSTVEYKALTRQHVGDVVLNVGDQWSDLQGGYADDDVKIPNPTYFLASLDLTTAPPTDALMAPPSAYSMQPDGSSGYTVATGDDIPNIDPVRTMIRGYYNAPAGTADKVASPYLSQLGTLTAGWSTQVAADCAAGYAPYSVAKAAQDKAAAKVKKAKKVVKRAAKAVAAARKAIKKHATTKNKRALLAALEAKFKARHKLARKKDKLEAIKLPAAPAVVLDADDTTLWNYDLEDGVMKFVYNPATAATWVSGHLFPAVPGMVRVVRAAQSAGCTVFGLTGRPVSQQADTVANLTQAGFTSAAGAPLFSNDHYFTKDTAHQPWVDCGPDRSCSTVEYKSGTRAHIEALGYDVVGNLGDQYSDLLGGHADHVYKVPNPTYYLP